MYMHLCISFVLIFSVSIQAMKVSHKIDPSLLTASDHLKNALKMLKRKNPCYVVFNKSSDIRNLSFLTPHLKRNLPQGAPIKTYEEELTTLYLVTLRHCDQLNSIKENAKYILIDLKRLCISHLREYPQTVSDKCSMLTHYLKKHPLRFYSLLSTIPKENGDIIKQFVDKVLQSRNDLVLGTVACLDKSQETGYFALFRFRDKKHWGMYSIVIELHSLTQFLWDIHCTNLKEYYAKHKKFLKKQLKLRKLRKAYAVIK